MRDLKEVSEFVSMNDYLLAARKKWAETLHLDRELFQDAITFYNEYFGYIKNPISFDEAMTYGNLGVRLNADLWKSMMPMNEEKMDTFYRITPFYFFHDILRFMDGIHIEQAIELLKIGSSPLLDFAGGTGGFSIFAASNGWDVTYCDSNLVQSAWVQWLNNKRNLGIKFVRDSSELKPKSFNFIIAKDIAEHVLDPGSLYNWLTSLLTDKGQISFTEVPCCGPEEFAPMHFKVDLVDNEIRWNIEENIKSLGRQRNETIIKN